MSSLFNEHIFSFFSSQDDMGYGYKLTSFWSGVLLQFDNPKKLIGFSTQSRNSLCNKVANLLSTNSYYSLTPTRGSSRHHIHSRVHWQGFDHSGPRLRWSILCDASNVPLWLNVSIYLTSPIVTYWSMPAWWVLVGHGSAQRWMGVLVGGCGL